MSWFAFDIPAYEADTPHLSCLEHGAYFLLIKHYMRTRVPLVDNDRALSNICGLTVEAWQEIAPTVRAFFKAKSGRLHQSKCDRTLDREDTLSKRRSEQAENAAKKRWSETKELDAASMAHASNTHNDVMLVDATRPDQTKESLARKRSRSPLNGHFEEFQKAYAAYPRHTARGAAEKAFGPAIEEAGFDKLMAGIVAYALTVAGKDPQYTAHFATWLRAKRWLDEPSNVLPIKSQAML